MTCPSPTPLPPAEPWPDLDDDVPMTDKRNCYQTDDLVQAKKAGAG